MTALSGLVSSHDVTWIASAVTDGDREVALERAASFEERDRAGTPLPAAPARTRAARLRPLLQRARQPAALVRAARALADRARARRRPRHVGGLGRRIGASTRAFAEAVIDEADARGRGRAACCCTTTSSTSSPPLCALHAPTSCSRTSCTSRGRAAAPGACCPRDMREAIGRGLLACDVVGLPRRGLRQREFLSFCEALPETVVDWRRRAVRANGARDADPRVSDLGRRRGVRRPRRLAGRAGRGGRALRRPARARGRCGSTAPTPRRTSCGA